MTDRLRPTRRGAESFGLQGASERSQLDQRSDEPESPGFLKFFPASQSSEGAVRYDGASLGRTEIPGGEFNKHLGPGVVSGHLPR